LLSWFDYPLYRLKLSQIPFDHHEDVPQLSCLGHSMARLPLTIDRANQGFQLNVREGTYVVYRPYAYAKYNTAMIYLLWIVILNQN